jgi:ferredoxin
MTGIGDQPSGIGDRYSMVSREALGEWLDGLAQSRTLIAPRDVDGILLYRPVKDSRVIARDFTRPVMSVKEFFFPPTERLFKIQKTKDGILLDETLPEGEMVIFGVRPCDARGVKALDALFIDTPPLDPYYARRRENTALIGMACREMGPTCFCTSVGGAPDDARDVDVMLYEVEGGYALQVITEKGRMLVSSARLADCDFQPSSVTRHAQPSVPYPSPVTLSSISWPGHFNDEYWARMSERCLSCRACAYVCPTCRCFAARDEMTAESNEFERIRCWDSCAGENYRRIAGGHRPRSGKSERLRNRFFCKFYYYPEQYGLGTASACTGCGRCIDVCPVRVDIAEVLDDLGRQA